MYRIHQIKLKPHQDTDMIPDLIRKKLGKRELILKNITIARESIDARDKNNIRKVYTVDFDSNIKLDLPQAPDISYDYVYPEREHKRPVIAGFGPCGIFAALIMARAGMRPIVLERGKKVEERTRDVERFISEKTLDPESNVQFGEGGAGAFSDGKLTTGIKDPRTRKVLEELSEAGGGKEILYKHRPHIGTDVLRVVVSNIRKEIEKLGGEVRFGARLTGIETDGDAVHSVIVNDREEIVTDDLVLAIGHSARDTFGMLADLGLEITQKPFSIGVRIQHPQSLIDRAQYGDEALHALLGAAEYKLSYHCQNGRGVYTFCMCPGGEVICASSEEGGLVTNGMSYHARDGRFANSALLADVRPEDLGSSDVFAGVRFQREYEQAAFRLAGGYKLPQCTWGDFEGSDVYRSIPGFASSAIIESMPALGRKLKGFDDPRTMMFAPETRSSSPVRFLRNAGMMARVRGIYPAGEGAGYAGGIVSAAVDGIKTAETIARRYR